MIEQKKKKDGFFVRKFDLSIAPIPILNSKN